MATAIDAAMPVLAENVKSIQSRDAADGDKSLGIYLKQYQQNQSNPKAIYNLAVTYYKLKKYSLSKHFFLKLLEFDVYHLLAKYNLGLVANKAGHREEATKWFRKINAHPHPLQKSDAASYKIKKLAQIQLSKLKVVTVVKKSATAHTDNFKRYIFAYYGNEDKFVDSAGNITPGADFLTLYGLFTLNLSDTVMPGTSWRFSYYSKNFDLLNSHDFHLLSTDFSRLFKEGRWRSHIRLGFSQSTYGSTDYQSVSRLDLKSAYNKLAYNKLAYKASVRYRYDDIASKDSLYDAYAGSQQRLDFTYDWSYKSHKLRAGLGFENNDRSDNSSAAGVDISYSARREKVLLSWFYKFNSNWKSRLKLEFRDSRYNDYSIADSIVRDETRAKTSYQLKYRLQKNWWYVADYRYTDNQSNITRYTYTRNTISTGISGYF